MELCVVPAPLHAQQLRVRLGETGGDYEIQGVSRDPSSTLEMYDTDLGFLALFTQSQHT